MLAPVRPYGCVFSYSGGSQKSIKGNYQFFEMDQNRLGAVVNHLNQAGIGKHIYCVLCGRMTPDQKQIVRRRAVVDTQLFIGLLTWFVNESGHPGYQNITIPKECPKPLFVEDQETNINTDELVNVNMETNIKSGTYFFPLHKYHQIPHQCTILLINLHLQCFSIQHQHCWHMVALMPTLKRWILKIFYRLLSLLVSVVRRWNKKWKSLMSCAFSTIWGYHCRSSGKVQQF